MYDAVVSALSRLESTEDALHRYAEQRCSPLHSKPDLETSDASTTILALLGAVSWRI